MASSSVKDSGEHGLIKPNLGCGQPAGEQADHAGSKFSMMLLS
jgi:hypothetical protein